MILLNPIRSLEPSAADRAAHCGPRTFHIGDVSVSLRSEVGDVLPEIAQLYGPWETIDKPGSLDVRVRRARSRYTGGRRFVVFGGDNRLFSVKRIEEVLPHVEWAVNWEVVKKLGSYLQIHAAVLQRGSRAFVFPGSPGSGKTTLAAGLMHRGWRLLSDEFAMIDPDSGMVCPYPKALCIKAGSLPVIQELNLPLLSARRYKKGRKGRVAYVSAATLGDAAVGSRCRIGAVLFPTYCVTSRPQTVSISRGEAVFDMNRLSFNAPTFGPRAIPILNQAMAEAQGFRLQSGELQATCDLVERMADEMATS